MGKLYRSTAIVRTVLFRSANSLWYNPSHEKMAILARGADQHLIYLAGITRLTSGRILGFCQRGELYLARAGHWCVLRRGMGTRLEVALFAWSHQKDPHEDHVSHHDDRIHGQ